jgi:uncharacterized membrane protein YphA (DoxX/SURF4 family)
MAQVIFSQRLDTARIALRVGLGLAAFVAGLDKFFGLLADWPGYLAPLVANLLPIGPPTFMKMVGVIEMVVGASILTRWPREGGFVAMIWLLCIAVNLVLTGRFFDVAVRDVEMAIAAFALVRLTEAHDAATQAVRVTTTTSAGRDAERDRRTATTG